jgi:hypothetical protein
MANSLKRLLVASVIITGIACGKSDSGKGPTGPTTPTTPTPANRSPTISSMSVSPTFGVSGLNTISMSASATDPDNDPLTYTWAFAGGSQTGASIAATLNGDGAVLITLTVADGKGGSATDTRLVTLGTLTGTWSLVAAACGVQSSDKPAVMTLTQTGGTVNGTVAFPGNWCNVRAGQGNSRLDPGAPGTIDSQGNFQARVKVGDFIDVFLNQGKMDTTGRKVTGKPEGSGFGNSTDVFTMTKQ